MLKKITYLIAVILLTSSIHAEDIGNGWSINGMAHIIGQLDGKDFSNETHPFNYATSKIRIGLEKKLDDIAIFRVDLQDSRIMGTGFFADQSNTDILQGYVEFPGLFGAPLSLQAGRFQMQYGTERIIGRSLWHYQERAFDGARLKYNTEKFKIDYFHILHTNSSNYMLKVMPSNYPYPAEPIEGYAMYGFWMNTGPYDGHSFDLFGYLEDDDFTSLNRWTAGFNYNMKAGKFGLVAEGAFQGGTQTIGSGDSKTEKTISAYMASLKANYKLDPVGLMAGADIISGTPTDATDEINTYNNYPASKHKFLGLMDYFLVTTKGTNNLGVNDFYVGANFGNMVLGKPASGEPGNLNAALTYHFFMSNQPDANDNTDWGSEIDLVLKYNLTKKIFFQAGGGIFLPGEVMKNYYKVGDVVREDPGFWLFTMIMFQI
jgi:hypothetical protein